MLGLLGVIGDGDMFSRNVREVIATWPCKKSGFE